MFWIIFSFLRQKMSTWIRISCISYCTDIRDLHVPLIPYSCYADRSWGVGHLTITLGKNVPSVSPLHPLHLVSGWLQENHQGYGFDILHSYDGHLSRSQNVFLCITWWFLDDDKRSIRVGASIIHILMKTCNSLLEIADCWPWPICHGHRNDFQLCEWVSEWVARRSIREGGRW